MTVVDDRPHMLPQEFEELARSAARTAEGLRLEFINGRLGVKAVPDGDHDEMIRWVMEQCMQQRPELWLYPERGLKVGTFRTGYARPDGILARKGSIAGQGEWGDPDQVLMVVEVTSYDSDTDKRDRVEKPRAYAETGIPVYLLIDRDSCVVSVHSAPDGVRYEQTLTVPSGKRAALPDPVGVVLDTEPLQDWVR